LDNSDLDRHNRSFDTMADIDGPAMIMSSTYFSWS